MGVVGYASDEIKKNCENTCKLIYNDEHYSNQKQANKTRLELYGNSNMFKTEHFKTESKNTKKERYNDEYYVNTEQAIDTCIERYGHSNFDVNYIKQIKKERYNDKNYNNREKARKTNLEKFGREIPYNTKLNYNGIFFDSKWEIYYYEYLKKNNIEFIYHPNPIPYYWEGDQKTHNYYPDFIINEKIIEIKNDYLYNKLLIPNTLDNAKYKKMLELNVKILRYIDLKEIIKEMEGEIKL